MSREPERRKLKLQSLLREEISSIIFSDIKDPRVRGTLISRVEVSSNLEHAKVFIVPHSEDSKNIEGLRSASGFIRVLLKKRLNLRIIPKISFEIDTNYGRKIESESE